MIRISNVPDWANAANSIREPIRTGKTYTASAVVKTENVTGAGAIVKFELLLASGGYAGQKVSTKVITGIQDWTRIFVSMTAAEAWTINPNAVYLRVCVGTIGTASGTMYFDAVRLLEGDIETIYSYDLNDNYVTAVRNQLGQTVNFLSDGRGNVTQMTDAKNNVYKFAYDKLDNIKAVENQSGFISYYFYDKDSNLTQIDNHQRTGPTTSAYLNTTIGIQYNELQLPKRVTDGNWRATTFAYDKNAQLTNVKFPNLKEINYGYDAVNRLKEVTYIGDSTRWDYDYDADSNLTMVKKDSSNSKVTDYVYDNLDRLEKVTYPYSGGYRNITEYTYNPTGQVLNTTHTLSAESVSEKRTQLVRYLYDQAGNNVDVIGPNNATAAAFMYDEELRLKKSFQATTNYNYLTYRDYDTAGRIIRLRTEKKTGETILDVRYEYDANGNRTKDIDIINVKRVEYDYDTINQLLEERYFDAITGGTLTRKHTYQYDLLGNRTQKVITVGPTTTTTNYAYSATANDIQIAEIVGSGTTSYTHDYNGNMTSSGNFTFTYNAENQLIRIQNSGVEVASYEYDHNGLRTKKITPSKTELYYYDVALLLGRCLTIRTLPYY